MWGRFAIFGLVLALSLGQAAVSAAPAGRGSRRCTVVAGEKYLGPGVRTTLCREIERAVGYAAPGARYSADISAQSPTRLSAALTVNGHKLPEHKFAVMDAGLSEEAIQRFARALAADIAKAAKK